MNSGVGPLIVESFEVSDDGGHSKSDLISWMPELPLGMSWETFSSKIEDSCLAPDKKISILKLRGDPKSHTFSKFRDEVRYRLKGLKITVKYKDVYNRNMLAEEKDLAWFGRNI